MYNFNPYDDFYANAKVIDYTVKPGDVLWKIAQRFNTTIDEIITYNNLVSTTIYPGQLLMIPTGTPSDIPNMFGYYKEFNEFPPSQVLPNTYMVQKGDTLAKIASKFNLTIEELLNLNPQLLQAGQVINIK